MRRAGRERVAIALGAAVIVVVASACFGGPPPPPPPPGPCGTSSSGSQSASTGGNSTPLPPDSAAQKARDDATRSGVRTPDDKIPLVTVEQAPNGKPVFNKTSVTSADEAGQVAGQQAQSGKVVAVEVASPVHASLVGPDPLRTQQWALDQVPYEQAWTTGSTKGAGITVGVVDTGSTASHPDLQGQVLPGHSFLNNGTESNSAVDDNGHGTHVSGILAAINNNATGVSGAAPEVQIRPVKVLDSNGNGFNSDVASGITWAVDNGAKVVNLSLGGPTFDQATCLAVRYAQQHDVVVVAAAGNCGGSSFQANGCSVQNQPDYPAALSQSSDGAEAIAVAATDEASPPNPNPAAHAPYSTVGDYVDISAPGGSSGTCTPASLCNILSTVPFMGTPISDPTGYKAIAGTSMATPYVSAAVALMRAAFPSCSASDVRARLLSTATDLGSPGSDATFGAGEVNPNAAITSCP